MSEAGFIVCGHYDLEGYHCDGSVMTNCYKCDAPLWIAPEGLMLVMQHEVEPICTGCAKEAITAGKESGVPIEFEELNKEQVGEIMKHMSLDEISKIRKEVEEELGL